MRLTNFTDYSLRVLIYVAAHPEGRATIREIAQCYGISEHHLTKVVHSLGAAGFLDNTRGRGGGIRLARAAQEINVGAVVRHTEGAAVPAACFEPTAPPCSIYEACFLRGVLARAVDAFHAVLDRHTLADLVHDRSRLQRILLTRPAIAVRRQK
jgi:Rrf2 family nitric oxide-sensitive transcriptional repressor